jgi:predicted O-methyltransferase YrrM
MLKKIMLVSLATVLVLAIVQSLTAQPPEGRGPGGRRGMGRSPAQEQPPVPANEDEKKILNILEDMNANQSGGMMNVPPVDGRLLRLFTEAAGAKHVVEIGTSNGYSGIWFCLALRTTGGKLTTHEIDARRASLARENFKRAGVDKLVTLVEGDAHEKVVNLKDPIDILFLDADKEGYIDYLKKLLPLVRPGGLILAHNVDSTGPDFIKAITADPKLETVLRVQGLSVTLKKR